MSDPVINFGLVNRLPPGPVDNGQEVRFRTGPYGEMFDIPLVRKQHALADEGSYFVCNNGQTGILSSPATGWVTTTPCCVIFNSGGLGAPNTKRIYLDYLALITTVVGSAASGLVNVAAAVYTDYGNRYSSGGTEITTGIVSPNQDVSVNSNARVFFGAITATAQVKQRAVCGLRIVRATVSGTVVDVVGEQKVFNFGGVESMLNGSVTVANANNLPIPVPPVIIGPNQSALIYVWQNLGGTNVAATYAPELAWWER